MEKTERKCLVDGCGCKDARILNRRTMEFWRDLAKRRGETGNRIIVKGA